MAIYVSGLGVLRVATESDVPSPLPQGGAGFGRPEAWRMAQGLKKLEQMVPAITDKEVRSSLEGKARGANICLRNFLDRGTASESCLNAFMRFIDAFSAVPIYTINTDKVAGSWYADYKRAKIDFDVWRSLLVLQADGRLGMVRRR